MADQDRVDPAGQVGKHLPRLFLLYLEPAGQRRPAWRRLLLGPE
jgi:hypothetical protein